ncbi:MAG TPA: signal peptide peptidase SppA [Burkholderiaceae bacterium]|jgi:protease-4
MAMTFLSSTRRFFARVWGVVDATRRTVLNLLFLAIVVAVIVVLARSGAPALADQTTLVLALKGPLVEQRGGNVRDNAIAQAQGDVVEAVQLRDVLAVLDAAAKDPKIVRVLLQVDDLRGAGLPMLREVAAALQRFKASGKQVIAWGSGFDQRQYYLAAQANEVWMHPLGSLMFTGFGGYRNYYLDALDKVGVTVNLVRVGTYKSAAEPYIANGPSPAAKEADAMLYNGLWATYLQGVEQARKLAPGTIMKTVDDLPAQLAAAGGDEAKMALGLKFVDALKTRDEMRAALIERGARDEKIKSFRQVSFDAYLAGLPQKLVGDAIGVVVAQGEIVDGDAPAGTIGGLSTAKLIREAREDDSIKAIVLRVDSPGGSVFGSELVRRELELARAGGKPVVVSMGNVAASGGYWISTASDEVIADPATVTGSIGVFGLLPSGDKALARLGVHTEGTTTTWLGGAGDVRLPPDPRFIALTQATIDHVYADFTGKVAKARKMTPQAIDAVGQGHVWTGEQAKARGLVDTLGSFGDALKSAATRAKLGSDYRVSYIEPEPGRLARALELVGGSVSAMVSTQLDARITGLGVPPKVARDLQHDLGWLAASTESRKPFNAVIHCLCEAP